MDQNKGLILMPLEGIVAAPFSAQVRRRICAGRNPIDRVLTSVSYSWGLDNHYTRGVPAALADIVPVAMRDAGPHGDFATNRAALAQLAAEYEVGFLVNVGWRYDEQMTKLLAAHAREIGCELPILSRDPERSVKTQLARASVHAPAHVWYLDYDIGNLRIARGMNVNVAMVSSDLTTLATARREYFAAYKDLGVFANMCLAR